MEVVISQRFNVAAFDFDCTLTTRDTLLPFLKHLSGASETYKKLINLSPYFCSYALGLTSRQRIKEKVLKEFIAKKCSQELLRDCEIFAKEIIPFYLNPEAMTKFRWHKMQGHRCVLVSAAIDLYLKPWGEAAGFHDIICSKCHVDSSGLLTGYIEKGNCWGEEKAVRLLNLLGPKEGFTLYAYGDSRGDKELLALADFPFYRRFS